MCQKKTAKKTSVSVNRRRNDSGAGYFTFEQDLTLFYDAGNKILGLTGNFLTWEMELLPHQQLTSRLLCGLIYDLISRFCLGPFSPLSWSLEQAYSDLNVLSVGCRLTTH